MTDFITSDSFFVYNMVAVIMIFAISVLIGLYNLEKDDKPHKKIHKTKKI